MRCRLFPSAAEVQMDSTESEIKLAGFFDSLYLSPKTRNSLLQDGRISVDSTVLTNQDTLLPAGSTLRIHLPEYEVDYISADFPCDVVYEDSFLYAAHKDAGIIIHSEKEDPSSLAAMAACYQRLNNIQSPVRYLHRLDKETTGLVLFNKIPVFQPWFDHAIQAKQIQRHYLAVSSVSCRPGKQFHWTGPIGRDRHRSGCYRVSRNGKQAETTAECIASTEAGSLFRLVLGTGRTHQIRVHMANAGFPINNDTLYGTEKEPSGKMALWAYEMIIPFPFNSEKVTIHDFMNPDFLPFAENIRELRRG